MLGWRGDNPSLAPSETSPGPARDRHRDQPSLDGAGHPSNEHGRSVDRIERNSLVMKTITTLGAAAVLALGLTAQAAEPVKLDDAALDQVTAGGLSYLAAAGTFPAFALTVRGGQGGFSLQSSAFSLRTSGGSGDQLKLQAKASGTASGGGNDFFVGAGGFVFLQLGQGGNNFDPPA